MKRGSRLGFLFWIGTAASVAIIVLWPLSLFWAAAYQGKRIGVGALSGALVLTRYTGYSSGRGWYVDSLPPIHREAGPTWTPSYFKLSSVLALGSGKEVASVFIPLWMLEVPLLAALGLIWMRRRRSKRNGCQQCGYNLTGNTSGICPECGTAIIALSSGHDRVV